MYKRTEGQWRDFVRNTSFKDMSLEAEEATRKVFFATLGKAVQPIEGI